MVDELGALETELAPYKAKLDKVEALRKALRQQYADSPAAEAFVARGERFEYIVGERGNENHITDIASLLKFLGRKLFLANCGMTITRVKALGADHLLELRPTGARTLKRLEKAQQQQKKAAA